ncbi:MAG: peptidoglycan DD-metalloendopeptidase family protein [Candidatus Zixiibacteriota bacterium]|jgi:murein DD-endopeptidase MepM/ murein hydrolase activator NlpD
MTRLDESAPTPRDEIYIPRRRSGGRTTVIIIATLAVGVAAFFGLGAWAGLFDRDELPPAVTLDTPAEGAKYAGVIEVSGAVDDASKLAAFTLLLDGADCTPSLDLDGRRNLKFRFNLDTARLADGKHELAVSAEDAGGLRADARATFYVENHPTVLELAFEPPRVDQGRVLIVHLKANKKLYDVEGRLWEQEFPFFKTDEGFTSIVGVRASCPDGDYPVVVTGYDAYDEAVELKGTVTVADGGYIKEHITITSPSKKKIFDPALEEKKMLEYRKVQSIITRKRDEQLWAGPFLRPAEGRMTSPFGTYRTFSTGGEERHLGTDIANKEGTPIRAANRGEVMLAEDLIVRGKAVIVDHGRGVFSIYNHLSDVAVEPGERVEKGQVIGYMGSTGLATGSHLHWEMRVFKWVVDPMEWTDRTFTYRSPEDEAKALDEVERGYEAALAAAPPEAKETGGGHLEPGELIPDAEGMD